MKILMLTGGHLLPDPHAPEIGGAARQCLKLSKALIKQHIDVTILTKRLNTHDPVHQSIDGVPVTFVNTGYKLFNRRGLKRMGIYMYIVGTLVYLLRHRQEFDIIHAHSALTTGFVGVLAARWLKKKSIIKVMNSGAYNDIITFRETKTIIGASQMAGYLAHCDAAITLNPLAFDELQRLGFKPSQLVSIANGVEVDNIDVKRSYTAAGPIRFLFVGRLAPAKGLEILLEAFKRLITELETPSCRLTIVGKGSLMPELELLAEQWDIVKYVDLPGEVPNVTDYLSQADIFVLPSRAEGISNALLEAMASGLPCITTDVPGNNTVIQHEQNGLLVEVDNPIELTEAMLRLVENEQLRCQLGQAARHTVEHTFSISTTANEYIRLYNRLIAASS